MRLATGTAFLWTGAAISAAGGVLLATGAWVNLPPEAVVFIAKTVPFVVGGVVMAAGAALRRSTLHGRGERARGEISDSRSPALGAAPVEIALGRLDPVPQDADRDRPAQ